MEIIGIILFVLWIVFRNSGERQRATERRRENKMPPPPLVKPQAPVQAKQAKPQTVRAQDRPWLGEGKSDDELRAMSEQWTDAGETAGATTTGLSSDRSSYLSPNTLREAVLWSEILKDPRCKRRGVRA